MLRTDSLQLPPAAGIALLSLCLGAVPVACLAAERDKSADGWVYGVAAREAADEAAAQQEYVDIGVLGRQRRSSSPSTTTPTPALTISETGEGVVVAFIDTGIDLDHPEFSGRVLPGTCIGDPSTKCAGDAALGADNNGHGTHVAGIVGAANDGVGATGVAPGASLLPVKVLDARGNGSFDDVAAGITYAATHGADVINMSIGGSSSSPVLLTALQGAAPTAVIVAAAGNGGKRLPPAYPAAYATAADVVGSMIIVGSVDANNRISNFSQTPGNGGCTSTGGGQVCFKDVFLVAPGRNIYSTYPDDTYARLSGTSMATPYVAGAAALVLSAAPYLTPQQVVSILLNSATDLGSRGVDKVYGHGLVNPGAALQPLGGASIATSGVTTNSYVSSGQLGISSLSGPIGYGVRHSNIAKSAVFFDAYGRDFHTDVTRSVASGDVSLSGVVASVGHSSRGVSAFGDGYAVSGFVADDPASAIETAGFADTPQIELQDVVVTARFGEGTTLAMGHNAMFGTHFDKLGLASSEAYDGLFVSASALNSPYLALTSEADYAASSFELGDGVSLALGHAEQRADANSPFNDGVLSVQELVDLANSDPAHLRSASNTSVALSWQVAPWAIVGLNADHTQEQNSILGSSEAGALALIGNAETKSVGVGARVNLGDDWVASASWSQGTTNASPSVGSLFQGVSQIDSSAYGVAMSKLGVLWDGDSLGFAVSRPLHVTRGSALMTLSTGVTENREIVYSTERVALASATPETNYEIGYATLLGQGVTLQGSTLYQQDVAGEAGRDGIAAFAMLRANW